MGTHYRGKKAEVQALDVLIKLYRASASVATAVQSAYVNEGLTESQFGVLELLYHTGPQSQLDIGRRILKSRGNITMVIRNLEKQGLVMRQRDELDRRYYSVNLTKKGHDLIQRIFPGHVKNVVETMSGLSGREQETLAHLCKKLGLSIKS